MRIDLSGKRAVVTGAAGGIGRAIVRTLVDAGARVAAVDIDEAGAREAIAGLEGAHFYRCDLGDPDEIDRLADRVLADWDHVDILVNNAGIIAYASSVQQIGVDDWDRLMQVNLRAVFLLSRRFLPGMQRAGNGRIINLSSLAARVGGIEAGAHYATSKAGIIGLTRTLAKEAAPSGTTVNAVAPGVIATPPVLRQVADHREDYEARIPLGRLGEPQDVANVVLFLASSLASYLTGLVIDINGGLYMG